jgi:hypothetical protein
MKLRLHSFTIALLTTWSLWGQELIYFSHPAGWHAEDTLILTIESPLPGADIYYTLDGSRPTLQAQKYTEPIILIPKQPEQVKFAHINTTIDGTYHGFTFRGPSGDIPTAQVVRAAIFRNGTWLGKPVCATFFLGEQSVNHTFPVFSLMVDSVDFFGHETGIYVPGKSFDDSPGLWSGNYHNRGQDWEREIHLEFFDEEQTLHLAHYAGVRIHGNYSRLFPFKTLRLYARTQYGPSGFHYPFFENREADSYDQILLRNSGQDMVNTLFADALSTVIAEDMDMEMQAFRPALVYLNGEYWGIHNIRERLNEETIARQTGDREADIQLVDFGDHMTGLDPNEDFANLYWFVREEDMTDEDSYNWVKQRMDINNFIEYYILKMYIGVYDWPGNNVRMWKSNQQPRWRWIHFDSDDAFLNADFDSFWHVLDPYSNEWPNFFWSTVMFRKLMENIDFKNEFLTQFQHHVQTTFEPERVENIIRQFEEKYEPEIHKHIVRHQYPESFSHWKNIIENFRQFFYRRCATMRNFAEINLDTLLELPCILNTFEPEVKMFTLYPNPADTRLIIEFEKATLVDRLTVYSAGGKLMENIPLRRPVDVHYMELGHLVPGVYFITAYSYDGHKQTIPLVKAP